MTPLFRLRKLLESLEDRLLAYSAMPPQLRNQFKSTLLKPKLNETLEAWSVFLRDFQSWME